MARHYGGPGPTATAPGPPSGPRSASVRRPAAAGRAAGADQRGRPLRGAAPGFLAVAAQTGLPLRLLEVGASAGLNLRWDRYRYEAEGFAWGPPDSPLRIEFELSGGDDPRRGGDGRRAGGLRCLARRPRQRGRPPHPALLHLARPGRPLGALAGRPSSSPPRTRRRRARAGGRVDRGASRPARDRPGDGRLPLGRHAVPPRARARGFAAVVVEAGERATAEAPLAWLRMEPAGDRAARASRPGPAERTVSSPAPAITAPP